MENQVIFKSALNGFEKSAVLKHIDELNNKLSQTEKKYQDDVDHMEMEKADLQAQILKMEIAANDLQKKSEAQLTAKEEELNAKNEQLGHLEEELKKLRKLCEEQMHELTIVGEQNRLLHEQMAETEGKVKKYDETAASIGDVILVARQNATHITDEASAKAEQILADARLQSEQMLAEARLKLCDSQKQMDELKSRFHCIRQQMDSSIAAIQLQLNQAEQCIDPAVKEAEAEPVKEEAPAPAKEEGKAEHPLKAILEQAANSNQKKNFFR